MRILYDAQIFASQRYGGISRTFDHLLRHWDASGQAYRLSLWLSANGHLDRWRHRVLPWPQSWCPQRQAGLLLRANRPLDRWHLGRGGWDLFHPTYYDPYFLDHLRGRPFVLTVYDMIHERFPEVFPPQDPIRAWKRRLLEAADGVICISNATREDLLRWGPPLRRPPTVIHLGGPEGDASVAEEADDHPLLREPFLLFVGARGGYKNFLPALTGLAPLLRERSNLRLLCLGGGAPVPEELSRVRELALEGQVVFSAAREDLLRAAYRRARLFLFPSLCEGFGLPVLEAFAAGCPVLACGAGSLPEVGGEAALYVVPGAEAQLAERVAGILDQNGQREALVAAGRERLQLFSWSKTALQTRGFYEEILSGRNG